MKRKPMDAVLAGMDHMSLPTDLWGTCHIELYGDRQILITGQRGIRTCLCTEMTVELSDGAIKILGRDLQIVSMTARELLIRGIIDQVGFVR